MRKVLWMALALMGTTPAVALAQQTMTTPGTLSPLPQTAGSPSGAMTIGQGQDSVGGPFGLQPSGGIYGLQPSAGSVGIQYPAFDGVPYQGSTQPGANGLGTGGSGLSGTGTSGQTSSGSLIGSSYQGTTPIPSSDSASQMNSSTQVNPSTGTLPGSTGTTSGTGVNPSLQSPTGSSPGTGVNTGTMQPGTMQPGTGVGTVPMNGQTSSLDEVGVLRDRVALLEHQVDSLRGTGGSGPATVFGSPLAAPSANAPETSTTISNVPGTNPEALKSASQASGSSIVASAVFDGRVRTVTAQHIDIVDSSDGSLYRLSLDKGTKVFRGSRLNRIHASQLTEGTPVRASFELTDSGAQNARYIVARPHAARASK